MLPNGIVPGVIAMLRSDKGSLSSFSLSGDGGARLNEGTDADSDFVVSIFGAGALERCAESGNGNWGGASMSSSSSTVGADVEAADLVFVESFFETWVGNDGTLKPSTERGLFDLSASEFGTSVTSVSSLLISDSSVTSSCRGSVSSGFVPSSCSSLGVG